MNKFRVSLIAVVGCSCLTAISQAQDTNIWLLPVTRLEAYQTNIGKVIIKATAQVGTVSAGTGILSVSYKELTDVSAGSREYGLALGMETAGGRCESLIDYDELDPLLNAVDYLNKVDWSVTSLPALDVFYNTKDGFRVAAFSSKRTSNIEIAVRSIRWNLGPVLLSRTEVAQLRNLIIQAKSKLDALRAEK